MKTENQDIRGNRKHKDALFRMVFSKKEDLLNLYSSTLQKIPTPQFIVFYNGMKEEPDRQILRLSDAFQTEGGCLECEALMLNINLGRNMELMEKCRRLEEYSIFVSTVRKYAKTDNLELGEAILQAIGECIEKGILSDILTDQRAEVFAVLLETFDKELYERDLRENIRAEVKEEVKAEVTEEVKAEAKKEKMLELIKRKLAKGKSIEEIADALEEDTETVKALMKEL